MSNDSARRVKRALSGDRSVTVTRAYALDDIHIRKGGTGRDVVAYAAVFMVPSEIVDSDGHYHERNAHGAFDRSIAERLDQIFSVYNHAKSLDGTPSDMWSVPLGRPLELTPDKRGLLTVTRYDPGPENDRILEAIKSGALRGMSYTGVFVRSDPELRGAFAKYEADRTGKLPLVTRKEIALIEYGPTPIPAFETAEVIGVRMREAMTLNGRDGIPLLHTGINLTDYDPGAEVGKMSFPASLDDMKSMYALVDEAAAGQDGGFGAEHGHLPHHNVTGGAPGPANLQACRNALQKADSVEGFPDEAMQKAKAHLRGHIEDAGASAQPDNKEFPVVVTGAAKMTTHAAPPAEDEAERAAAPAPGPEEEAPVAEEETAERAKPPPPDEENAPGETEDDADEDDNTVKAARAGDDTAWDAGKVWSAGSDASDPAAFFRAVCAGRRKGDPKLQSTWALPHHYTPGGPPNAGGVRNALARLSNTQGLVNAAAAKAHLEAHMRAIQGNAKSDSNKTSSSGRKPAAVTPPLAGASTGTSPHGPQPHPAVVTNPTSRSEPMDLMTIDQRQARLAEVQHRLREIDAENMGAELPADTRTEWTALQQELVEHQRAIKDASARAEYLRTISEDPEAHPGAMEGLSNEGIGFGNGDGYGLGARTAPTYAQANGRGTPVFYNPMRPEQIFDLAAIRNKAHNFDEVPVLMRQHAMRAIEVVRYAGPKTREDCQDTVSALLDRVDDEHGTLARRVLTTGSPLYDRAFGKMLGQLSVNGLSSEESRALQLGVDSAGGFAVPFQLDPTVILSSNGAINPLRQIARVEQITGKEWDGVTSAGVVVNRVAEGTEAATGDPLFVQPNVRTTRVQGFVPFNIELDVSWGALRSQMTNLLMDAKDIEEATSFTTGNGTAPNANGVIGTMPAAQNVNTAGTATLAIGDLYNLENQMPPRFRQQSAYLASKATYNRFRQLFQALASAAFDSWVRPSAGTPATFNGYPAYELSTMTTAISSGSQVLLQGDFSQFLIVDRIGMGIELIPHLFGATNRYPVGQRGILAIWFNNSRILVPNAFRLLVTA